MTYVSLAVLMMTLSQFMSVSPAYFIPGFFRVSRRRRMTQKYRRLSRYNITLWCNFGNFIWKLSGLRHISTAWHYRYCSINTYRPKLSSKKGQADAVVKKFFSSTVNVCI